MFTRLIAGTLALIAFSAAIIAGLIAGNPFTTILGRAWLSMVVFFILGAISGAIVQAVIDEHYYMHKQLDQQEEEQKQGQEQESDQRETQQRGTQSQQKTNNGQIRTMPG